MEQKKILVVEEDFINTFMLKQYLGGQFTTLYARDGHEVVKLMNENEVDLVLLHNEFDSFGLNTEDLVKYIRAKDQNNKIKVISMYRGTENETDKSIEIAFDEQIQIPYTKDEVLKSIDKVFALSDEK